MIVQQLRKRQRSLGSLLAIAAGAILSAGCAHESTTSTIRGDGSWTRKTTYSLADSDEAKGGRKLSLRDVFSPPSGAGWTVVEKKTGEKPPQITVIVSRELRPAETITGDLMVKAGAKKGSTAPRVVNTAAVRPAGPGRWQYTETFHWSGFKPNIAKEMAPLVSPSVKKALPPGFASSANAAQLSVRIERNLWKTLFSPPEPFMLDFYDNLLPITGFSDPDERTGDMSRKLGPGIETALMETFGSRMSRDLRHRTAVRLVEQIAADTSSQAGKGDKMGGGAGKGPGTDSATESFGGMYPVAISITVKLPGRVTETNGIVDELAGEVYWTLYPQSALEQDVTLRATFEANGRQQVGRR